MMGKLLKMQMLEDEDDLAYETEKKQRSTSSSDAQPAWMRTLHTTARNWLQLIPESVNPLKRTVENIKVLLQMFHPDSRLALHPFLRASQTLRNSYSSFSNGLNFLPRILCSGSSSAR